MLDILLAILKWWVYGMPVLFVVEGIRAALDPHDYGEFLGLIIVSILWPIYLVSVLYGWLETVTNPYRPWYYLFIIALAAETLLLFYLLLRGY